MNKLTIVIFICFSIALNHQTFSQCHIDDWTALKALYESTDGSNWANNTNWHNITYATSAADCSLSNVYGLQVDFAGRVTVIDMIGNNLTGSLPPEIEKLAYLRELYLYDNELSGTIPKELGNLNELVFLYLNNNNFSGEIPASLANLTNLIVLFAYENELSGTIPSELGALTKIEYLGFGVNQLSGQIPVSFGNLNRLVHLSLDQNNLTGNIPKQLGNLSGLNQLWLWGNNLSGQIPIEIGQLNQLTSLSLRHNQLSGELPKELGSLSNLNELDVLNNNLTGSIPGALGNLLNLKILRLADNELSGCYDPNLNRLCALLEDSWIEAGNNFDAIWDDFCITAAGACAPVENQVNVLTNYSGSVSVTLDNNQNILKNNLVTIYDYGTCTDYSNITNCNPVIGLNNLAANEALWAATNAAAYFSINHNIAIPPVNILVSYTEAPNKAKYNITNNVIVLGTGDGAKRGNMSAPDIIGHEYTHAVISAINNLGNYKISGAFNESFADIFGELIEQYCYGYNNDWVFGKQVMINAAGNQAGLRNLSYPNDNTMQYQLPNTYKGEHWLHIDNACFHVDNCGIHTNSGVQSYWFYLLAYGGSGTNDDGYNFNVNGIGAEKAASILYNNLEHHLTPQSTFIDARTGSIYAAQTLYSNQPAVLAAISEAWDAVGIYEVAENPIEFQITNAVQTDDEFIEDGQTVIPVQFDLSIDSLGLDISADELCFTLHKPDTYMEMNIDAVYEPLTIDELTITKSAGELNICINRTDEVGAKKGSLYRRIASNSPILSSKICIVSEDVDGTYSSIAPMGISGFTEASFGEQINFETTTLPFGFDYDNEYNSDIQTRLRPGFKVTHKNCNTLGAIEIRVPNSTGVLPYTFTLKDVNGIVPDKNIITDQSIHQFYMLEEGAYEVKVSDSYTGNIEVVRKEISVEFAGGQNGSICCAENLIIPPGKITGVYDSNSSISFSEGAFISEGTFEICD